MKKNFLKSAMAVAALESIDSAEQVKNDQQVADQVVAGTNLPSGGAADTGGAPAGVASTTDQTTVPVTDVAAASAAVDKASETGNDAAAAGTLNPATEAFSDRVKGFIFGTIGGGYYGGKKAGEVSAIKQEIDHICQKIFEVSQDAGKAAVKEGKLSAEDFKQTFPANPSEVKKGALRGAFLSGFYGASKNNELAELKKQLNSKMSELDEILKAALKPANESEDAADEAAAAAGEPSASDISTGSATDPGTPSPDQVAPSATGDAAGAPAEGTAPADASAAAPVEGTDAAATGEAGAADAAPAEVGATDAGADLGADLDAPAGGDLGGDAGSADGAGAGGDAAGADGAGADLGGDADAGAEQPDVNAPAGEQTDVAATDTGAAEGTGGEGETMSTELTEEADAALSEEIVSSIGEVDSAAGQIADVESDVETMNEALESLDNCNAILRRSIQRGGLNQDGAALLRNNLNTVTKTLKIRPLALPALEDMEDPSAKIDAADTAASQVTGLMQRISETVRGGLKSFGEWIANTTAQLTDVYARLEKRADLLGQRAANAEGDKGGEVEAVGMVAGGQPVQNLVKYLQGLEKSVVALGQAQTYDSYIQLLDTAEELVKDPAQAEELAATATKQLLAFRKKIASVSAQGQGENAGGAVHFLGNRSVQFSIPGDLNDLAGFSSKTVSGGEAQTGSVPAMKQKEVVAVCGKVKELAGNFRQSLAEASGNVKQINKRITDKMGVIVDLSSRLDPKDGESGGSVRKAANWVSRIVTTSSKLPVHAVYAEVPRTLTIALDFASKSIGAARPAVAPEVAAAQ